MSLDGVGMLGLNVISHQPCFIIQAQWYFEATYKHYPSPAGYIKQHFDDISNASLLPGESQGKDTKLEISNRTNLPDSSLPILSSFETPP
jgi:hypothetical protein